MRENYLTYYFYKRKLLYIDIMQKVLYIHLIKLIIYIKFIDFSNNYFKVIQTEFMIG